VGLQAFPAFEVPRTSCRVAAVAGSGEGGGRAFNDGDDYPTTASEVSSHSFLIQSHVRDRV
jgi:hypothetical protein